MKAGKSLPQVEERALRASSKPLYHLVPAELLEAVAEARAAGDLKYAPGNWKQGGPVFFIDSLNHAIEHLIRSVDPESDESMEVHLGHAATNLAFILWALKRGIVRQRDFLAAAELFQAGKDAGV